MKYTETGFRPLYHKYCIFPLSETIRDVVKEYPGYDYANGVLTYGYIDRETGFRLEILCCVQYTDSDHYLLSNPSKDVRTVIQIGAVADEEYLCVGDLEDYVKEEYEEIIDMVHSYDVSEEVEESRSFKFLDEFRNELYPDDVLVLTVKEGLTPEGCWVRITDLYEECILGTLLNEPNQDFGFHEGDSIAFFLYENEGNRCLISDMNESKKLTAEDLENGSMLCDAIKLFHERPNNGTLFHVLELLRDSYIWIPCNVIVSEKDQKNMEEASIGMELQFEEDVRLIPDILMSDDDYYFPVFTSDREMGEYGQHFSKVEKHFLEAIALARANEKDIKGIVINAFTEPMVIDCELFDVIENLKSRL